MQISADELGKLLQIEFERGWNAALQTAGAPCNGAAVQDPDLGPELVASEPAGPVYRCAACGKKTSGHAALCNACRSEGAPEPVEAPRDTEWGES